MGRGQGGGDAGAAWILCVERSRVTIALEGQWPFETVTRGPLCAHHFVQRCGSPHHPLSSALAMLGLLKRTVAISQRMSMSLHDIESRRLSPEDTAGRSTTSIQALDFPLPSSSTREVLPSIPALSLPALPSIIPELSSMGIPPTAVDELSKLYETSVHKLQSIIVDSHRGLVAGLGSMPSVDAASRDRLHKAMSVQYLKGAARVKEDALSAARRIADDRAKETSPFKEVWNDYFPPLYETDVL
jgi:hypothetical protein